MNSRHVKQRIRAHLRYWVPMLGLAAATITVEWSGRLTDGRHALAGRCRPQPAISKVDLAFNPRGLAATASSDREVEELTVHELLHAVMIRGSERATNTLAHVLVELRRRPTHSWEEAAA